MEFDKSKILTVVTADQAKVGQKGWFASNVETMSRLVLEEQPKELLGFDSNNAVHAFKTAFQNHALFYPAPEPTPVFNSLKEYMLAELDWVEKNRVWAGVKVKIVASFTNPNGWEGWLNSDDFIHPSKLIDGEFVVRNVVPRGINLYLDCVRRKDGLMKDWFTVPFYVLEVVEPSKKPIVEFCKYSRAMDSFRRYANGLEPPEPTYAERQAQWVKENNVKAGTKVRVTRTFTEDEDGSSCCEHDDLVGMTGIIREYGILPHNLGLSHSLGVTMSDGNYRAIPYFALEVIKEPTYRPYNSNELNDLVGEVLTNKQSGRRKLVTGKPQSSEGVNLDGIYITAKDLLESFYRNRDEPCGVKEEV